MANVKIDGLADAVMKELAEYNQEVTDGIKKDIRTVAKECAKEIKISSPKDTGEYAKSWSTTVSYTHLLFPTLSLNLKKGCSL